MARENEGIFVELASAAAQAALTQDVTEGRIGRADHPVLILTEADWKDLRRIESSSTAPAPMACYSPGNWVEKGVTSAASPAPDKTFPTK